MKPSVHQILAVFDEADAQGHMALLIRKILRNRGIDSEIYAGIINPGNDLGVLPAERLAMPGDPEDTLIHHYSINSPVGEIFRRTFRRQVLIYHNVTEAGFFRGWDNFTYFECRKGRRALKDYIPTCDLALGVSAFNASELEKLGFDRVGVLPFPFDEARLEGPVDEDLLRKISGRGPNILFVGRITPNKKQEDVLKVFYCFQKLFRPEANLFFVGSSHIPSYSGALERMKEILGLDRAYFTGKVTWEEMRAYYRGANLFLCLSEHEGFCVPLMEAFHYGVPVIAYRAAAIPETMGGAGILLEEKNPVRIAALLDRVLNDEKLKKAVTDGQKDRLLEFTRVPFEEKLDRFLRTLI